MRRKALNIPDDWFEMVSKAIGETPYVTQAYVLSLWESGWSVRQIQDHLVEKAAANHKMLFFVTKSEPHEQS